MDSKSDKPIHPLDVRSQGSNYSSGQQDVPIHVMTAPRRKPVQQDGSLQLPLVQPVLTYVLLVTNLIVFVADILLGQALTNLGANYAPAIHNGEYWRLITSIFLHANLEHILANSVSLWLIGTQVERTYGYLRFAALYILSGLAGSVASLIFYPDTFGIGASGAIFGLIGAMLVFMVSNRQILANPMIRIIHIIIVIILNFYAVAAPASLDAEHQTIGYWAHIGGVVAGILLAWRLVPHYVVRFALDGRPERIDNTTPQESGWLWVGFIGAVLIGIIFFIIQMQR